MTKIKADREMRVCFGAGCVMHLTTESVEVADSVAEALKDTPGVEIIAPKKEAPQKPQVKSSAGNFKKS